MPDPILPVARTMSTEGLLIADMVWREPSDAQCKREAAKLQQKQLWPLVLLLKVSEGEERERESSPTQQAATALRPHIHGRMYM